MSDSSLSFTSSSSFRNILMAKNLAAYSVMGVYTPTSSDLNYEVTLSQSPVIDSPNDLITNDPYAKLLYPLNEYGPNGGFNTEITYNRVLVPIDSNQGEYNPNDTVLDLVNEFYIDAAFIANSYGPVGGYNDMLIVTDIQNNDKLYLPYWDPSSFVSSTYSPYDILFSKNPNGNNGSLSQDSYIAKLGASQLNYLFQERIAAELIKNTVGRVNLQSLQDPFEVSMMVSGKQPLIYKNWKITVPENPVIAAADFATRLAGAYWPVSLIPGDYFDDNNENSQTKQTSTALNVINQLTGGFLGPILNIKRNPSEIFLNNTGNGQRSVLFANINYNRYQPSYDKNYGGLLGVAQGLVNLAVDLINPSNGTLIGGYYVGSKTSEPSSITSPPNKVPVNAFGQQESSPVYGPSELGILFEGNEGILKFGLAGKSSSDGGGIDGQLVWTSPKYKSNAGFHATPGGGSGSLDTEFNEISSSFSSSESTNIDFKDTSILDQTQRLVNSADNVSGIARLKHVGNAINQVSKVFHDGYKEITKGSQVLSYSNQTTGENVGIEYCRVFTKDTPYYTYADLQKTEGITTKNRGFTNSVLDNTFNLNIAPLSNPGSTNIIPDVNGKGGYAKKYMFSIENLAWRTSSRPGFTYDELPVCEKGPNGGRVMWFPPYDLKFSDTSNAGWNKQTFLGRPEPIYTYKETTRTGSLSWKMIVDHPSIMNVIVKQQLKGKNKDRINSIIDSFFAGCVKYDIYELAIKFNTIPTKDLYTYQTILSNPKLTPEELKQVAGEISADNAGTNGSLATKETKITPDTSIDDFKEKYKEFAFYFENDTPDPDTTKTTSSVSYEQTYNSYISPANITKYQNFANGLFNEGDFNRNVTEFFNKVVIDNFNKIAGGTSNFIIDAYNILKEKKGKITINMVGSASALAKPAYNTNLSLRRNDSVVQFLTNFTVGEACLGPFIKDKTFIINPPQGAGETTPVPKTSLGLGKQVNCSDNIKDKNGKVVNQTSEIFAATAMACRRVKIGEINVTPSPTPVPAEPEKVTPSVPEKVIPVKPQPTVDIQKSIKEGISKQIIRQLLSECDYFEVIAENSPMVYDSIKEKIKYFNPAFHSMTPEGLNSRLTFLNQCVRPGETIPVIGTDNKPRYNDAVNTSFGAPPVLVLRIGDFYNSKIIPNSVAFTYEPLLYDLNPEGIGVQPMLANVTMSFDFIGGQGLARPVEQLQNALSFNYYANTEIYDERATATEDTSALDAKVVEAIVGVQPLATVNNIDNSILNNGGNTIGNILTNIPITSGQTGQTEYSTIMDKVLDATKEYYTNIPNQCESIIKSYNYGIWQLITQDRLYSTGHFNIDGGKLDVPIYGKPGGDGNVSVENKIDTLFSTLISDINADNPTNKNPLIMELVKYRFTDSVIQKVKTNLNNYINSYKGEFSNGIFTKIQEITTQEESMVQYFRKINLLITKTDGKILENGKPRVYNIKGTTEVNSGSAGPPQTTYIELSNDYKLIGEKLQSFDKFLKRQIDVNIITSNYTEPGLFTPMPSGLVSIEDKRQFMVLAQIFGNKNKYNDFINKIISGELLTVKSPSNLKNKFEKICDNFKKIVDKELLLESNHIKKIKEFPEYTKYVNEFVYPKGKLRKFEYTTIPDTATDAQQQKDIMALYSGVNSDSDNKSYDGKIKFK